MSDRLKLIGQLQFIRDYECKTDDEIKTMCKAIALLSEELERKTGRWIEISSLHHTYKCSECGRLLVNITDGKNNVVKHYPYCHCGARMEVEHETD